MADPLYRFLKYTAIVLTLAWVGWSAWDGLFAHRAPGDTDFLAGERAFEDGHYEQALEAYDRALAEDPGHAAALRGRARALLQLGRHDEALAAFDRAIERAPEVGATWANRGILHDRMGHYDQALADYEHALRLDPDLARGPNWLTRFLRLQPEPPPTVADRAQYLRRELAKPRNEQVLHVPELDSAQRPYKM